MRMKNSDERGLEVPTSGIAKGLVAFVNGMSTTMSRYNYAHPKTLKTPVKKILKIFYTNLTVPTDHNLN